MTTRSYGVRLPGMPREKLSGKLIVVEGADGSGRTTEVGLLREWLEIQGHAVVDTGLRRSTLLSEKIDEAKKGHTLGATTLALFYAADFADQLENKIVPSLAAGSTVLADRYIYTLMARAIVRGASREWAQRAPTSYCTGRSRSTGRSTTGSRAWTCRSRGTASRASSSTRSSCARSSTGCARSTTSARWTRTGSR
jgi:hypothetical protein